jgi:8-oxo-dGTP diphosphatase
MMGMNKGPLNLSLPKSPMLPRTRHGVVMVITKQRFFYCPKCGGKLFYRKYPERSRLTCDRCHYIFYENPVVGVAAIILNDRREILLGRRTGSYRGYWCIPCGYVEYEEDVYLACIREYKEETGLDIAVTGVFTVQSNFHNPEMHTVGIWLQASITGGQLQAGGDLDAAGYFPLTAPPPLAFPTDALVLKMLQQKYNP